MNKPGSVKVSHGKIPEWYTQESQHYDAFNEDTENSRITNHTIEKILKKYQVKTVLDLTCGTGLQVFWLAKRGYEVTGSDLNASMLNIAKRKALTAAINLKFIQGDMRTIKVGQFDAAITIFNAIGHLTKADFEKTMRNIYKNLNPGGIYIFDILNLNYVTYADNITKLSYEWVKTVGDMHLRELQHSLIDPKGVLASYTTTYVQKNAGKQKASQSIGTLQLYTAAALKEMLAKNGFKVLVQSGIAGDKFSDQKTERILTVAQKINKNPSDQSYWIYMLACENNTYYTGYTTDLKRRFNEHVIGSAKCKYTRSFKPLNIAQCWEVQGDKSLAMKIEKYIKTLSKPAKDALIKNPNVLEQLFQCKSVLALKGLLKNN